MLSEKQERPKTRRFFSLSGIIAWLSLFMLAPAWGRAIDARWQGIWARAGAFGLAAAVGLGSLEKARLMREKYVRNLASRISFERLESRLTRLNEQSAALELIDDAIRRLTKHVAAERHKQVNDPSRGKYSLAVCPFPLKVVPVENDGEAFDLGSAPTIDGSLRSISTRIASFEHDEAFSDRVVLLEFTLRKNDKLCFVVDVMWTKDLADRFISSGTVMAVGVPAIQMPQSALVAVG